MSENVQSAMFEILKSVQASIARIETRLAEVDGGQAELKDLAKKQRRDVAGIIVMMKSVAGDFDERVSALEQRMDQFEGRPPS